MVETGFQAFGNIQNASWYSVVAVGNLRRIDFDGLAAGKKRHLIFLRGRSVFHFVDVRIAAAHFSPLHLRLLNRVLNRGAAMLRPTTGAKPPRLYGLRVRWK